MDLETILVRSDANSSAPGSYIDTEYVMHLVFSGSFTFQYEKEIYSVSGHELILMRPNTLHSLLDLSGVNMLVVHFTDRSNILSTLDFPCVVALPVEEMKPVIDVALLLRNRWPPKDPLAHIECDGLVQTLVGTFLRLGSSSEKKHAGGGSFKNWEAVRDAVQHIGASFQDPGLTVQGIADRVGLSYNYFCSFFHQYTNETPLAYITRVRIDNAKRLLFTERKNVSEAATACGFRSIQAFSKTFHKIEGISPTRWLKKQQD